MVILCGIPVSCALFLFQDCRIVYVLPFFLALNVCAIAWLAIELTLAEAPENLFIRLSSCQVLNISDTIPSVNPCLISFEYEWLPEGINAAEISARLISTETFQLADTTQNITLAACQLLAENMSSSIEIGSSACYRLDELYEGYRDAINCAETLSGSLPGISSSACFTLLAPKSTHEVEILAAVLFACGLLTLLCPAIGIGFLLLIAPGSS